MSDYLHPSAAFAVAEVYGSASEELDLDTGLTASVQLRGSYADRHAIAAAIMGQQWPHNTNYPSFAKTVSIAGEGQCVAVGQCLVWESAVFSVSYNSDRRTTDFVSEEIKPTIEFQRLDHRKFRWGAADGPPLQQDEAPGKQVRGLSVMRTLYNVTTLPPEIYTAVGKVNDAAYNSTLLQFNFPEETLLYGEPSLSRTFAFDQTLPVPTINSDGWNVTLEFQYKEQGWNKFWRAEREAYEAIWVPESETGAGDEKEYKNYPLVDLSPILF